MVCEAEALALRLAAGPSRAYGVFKALFARDAFLQDHLDAELENIAETAASRDGTEGIAAFIGRRKPVFTGE
ncbi:hypothetical protein GCM10010909_17850 [Acidocella aquatica]|uniref:Enoyl-CoA hydratase n=1 Tax=Acidocella aquatica TaxID=1922313 RepID=A0ABQ6A3P4_9PROT|nr:hypothetical protein GCM10010909_17850 [Acidocella aquatica]